MRKLLGLLLVTALLLVPASGVTLAADNTAPLALTMNEPDPNLTIQQDFSFLRGTRVFTGTLQSVYRLSNPAGIHGLQATGSDLANYSVEILSQTATSADVRVTSQLFVDTRAAFPVKPQSLPAEIVPHLMPSAVAQSDDPSITALASQLSAGQQLQGQVVDATIAWVRGHIAYDTDNSSPTDAVSVLANREGNCAGYVYLSLALLRASGIPARYASGALYLSSGNGHFWLEVYYPDAGWVPTDPQLSANYIDSGLIRGGFDEFGQADTTFTRLSFIDNSVHLYTLRTPYEALGNIETASISSWDRQPISATPALLFILDVDAPQGALGATVNSNSSYDYWRLSENSAWLSVDATQGDRGSRIGLQVNAAGMTPGVYETMLTFTDGQLLDSGAWMAGPATSRVPVKLILMEDPLELYVPRISR